jgi:hypothetical protein
MPIDPNLMNVLLGVVANGLTAIIAGSYNMLKGQTTRASETKISESLNKQIRQALEEVSDTIEWIGPPRVEEICLFITSSEVEGVVRQLYAANLITEQRKAVEDIREEFQRLFAYRFGLEHDESKNTSDILFNTLLSATEGALSFASRHGVLSAHEAKSMFRFRILRDELVALRKNVEFLTSRQIDISAINRFERRYREQIADRHGRITPPNFDDARKLPIDSIYVVPNFTTSYNWNLPDIKFTKRSFHTLFDMEAGSAKFLGNVKADIKVEDIKKISSEIVRSTAVTNEYAKRMMSFYVEGLGTEQLIGLPDLLAKLYRTVILGNPGGGKSTLTNKICYDFTKASNDDLNRVTPIPVILREYGSEKRTHNYSILEFIEATAADKYQIAPPPGAFEYLLLNGRAAVIFDGLDELLETGYRQEIRDDIESFCNHYPTVPVIVTSREVGYEQAPLNGQKFETYRLAPFNDEQVGDYVKKWFDTRFEYTSAQRQQKAHNFIQESQIVSDLRSNPLMLGLMCNIYRGENYIPKNRPDVYRKCAEMLFERWDRSREIPVTFHFEDDIRPAMAYLAHWIYSDVKLQEGVTEQKLIEKAAGYLLEHRFENRDRAERAAREFIEFCRGRAWVFTEAGTDKEGEGLYQFTHRTFLEYFTAVYLVRTHETTEDLVSILMPHIRKREWDIVAQLAFQIKNRSSEGAKDKLLSSLLVNDIRLSEQELWNLLSFAARCLEFMEPSPRVTREIATVFVKNCLSFKATDVASKLKKNRPGTVMTLPDEVFRALILAGEQNIETIANSLKDIITDCVKNASPQEAILALEIGLHLDSPTDVGVEKEERNLPLRQLWKKVSDDILTTTGTQVLELAKSNFTLCREVYNRKLLTIEDVIEHFGMSSLFRQARLKILTDVSYEPLALTLLRYFAEIDCLRNVDTSSDGKLDDIRKIGQLTLNARASLPSVNINPKISFIPLGQHLSINVDAESVDGKQAVWDADLIFGVFIILAAWMEIFFHKVIQLNVLGKKGKKKGNYPEKTAEFRATVLMGQYLKSGKPVGIGGIFPHLRESDISTFKLLGAVLFSRYTLIDETEIDTSLSHCGFSSEQEAFIRSWMKRELSLVNPTS